MFFNGWQAFAACHSTHISLSHNLSNANRSRKRAREVISLAADDLATWILSRPLSGSLQAEEVGRESGVQERTIGLTQRIDKSVRGDTAMPRVPDFGTNGIAQAVIASLESDIALAG